MSGLISGLNGLIRGLAQNVKRQSQHLSVSLGRGEAESSLDRRCMLRRVIRLSTNLHFLSTAGNHYHAQAVDGCQQGTRLVKNWQPRPMLGLAVQTYFGLCA